MYFFSDVYEMLQWFGVTDITVQKIRKSRKVVNGKDINIDKDHPPEEALNGNITVLKPCCDAQAWKKVESACK